VQNQRKYTRPPLIARDPPALRTALLVSAIAPSSALKYAPPKKQIIIKFKKKITPYVLPPKKIKTTTEKAAQRGNFFL
jgi:hypothetical protein